ncbi:hypothetical protein CRG98_005794 [Punica granatum]|uniref:Uncharacterized protein n=1 Tax=Punica granatum TaxID=22663 RepID=A0A2I0KZR2_PUNGR|nr:hypothetical protein CRG98_005794 [Punica granatum]
MTSRIFWNDISWGEEEREKKTKVTGGEFQASAPPKTIIFKGIPGSRFQHLNCGVECRLS